MTRKRKPKFEWQRTDRYASYDPREKAKDRRLQRTYGITLARYYEMLEAQEYACDLCRRHKDNFTVALAVDHNHKTGTVRGLVCYACNKFRIGRNNLDSATKLFQYMDRYERKVGE